MSANIPDLGAVSHLGSQFQTNVFTNVQKGLTKQTRRYTQAHNTQVRKTAINRQRFAESVAKGVLQGQAAQQRAAEKQTAAGAKTMQQQRNFAHGQALNYQAAQFRVQRQQVSHAHGQAIQEAKQRSKGGSVSTASTPRIPSLAPSFSNLTPTHTPIRAVAIPATSFSSQLTPQKPVAKPQGTTTPTFSSGSSNGASTPATAPRKPPVSTQFSSGPKDGGGDFPQHHHPEGSSTMPLPRLTAAQPKPNTFTVGSRNAKAGGIAAKGSQLEAWAIGRQAAIRSQRGNQ